MSARYWTCVVCHRLGRWGKGWQWYGSRKDEDELGADAIARNVVCSDACAEKHTPDWPTKGKVAAAERDARRAQR